MKGYDLDGVLAPAPPPPPRPWRKMKGPERQAYRATLTHHYATCPALLIPEDATFFVITARRHSPITETWVRTLLGPGAKLFCLPPGVPKTYPMVADWKASIIKEHGITDYYEDNPTIVRLIKAIVGDVCRVTLVGPGGGPPPRRVRRTGRVAPEAGTALDGSEGAG